MASVFRTLVQKLGSSSAAQFIGRKGDLFFDPDQATPILKVSDGTTPGGGLSNTRLVSNWIDIIS